MKRLRFSFLHTLLLVLMLPCVTAKAQTTLVRSNSQKSINATVPPGNYSGITRVDGSLYAVVSDKSETDGFYIFNIKADSITGEVQYVSDLGFRGDSVLREGDCEGIAYCKERNTVFISREADNSILEFDMNGRATGRKLNVPSMFSGANRNYGFESLTRCDSTGVFWTVTESTLSADGVCANATNGAQNRLRLQSFDGETLQPLRQYAYLMDAPTANNVARNYAMGVSELTALDNGNLLVLEREFYVPQNYLGAFVKCKIYEVSPDTAYSISQEEPLTASSPYLKKHLVYEFQTKLNLTNRSIANYEGMCLGPKLADGSQVLILISDSQNRYNGVLKDWIKTIVVR